MIRRGLMVGLALLAAACSTSPPTDPDAFVVAQVADRTYTVAELQVYLDQNLVAEDELDEAEGNAVKSRLFDAFVEERLLLSEADRRGLAVSDLEVEAYLGLHEDGSDASVTRTRWDEAVRRLKIEKLLEEAVRDMPPEAADAADGLLPAENGAGRRLRLRSLMLESAELAGRVRRDIVRRRITFDEAVVAHASSPEQGLSTELYWDRLSEDQRRVLEGLKPGQVSQPLESGGGVFLFQLEAWIEAGPREPAPAPERAREWAEQARRARAQRTLQAKLAKSVEIKVYLDRLPFAYVEDDSVEPSPWNRVSEGTG